MRLCESMTLTKLPQKFGERVTADHIIAQDVVDESALGDRTAVIVLDRATKW